MYKEPTYNCSFCGAPPQAVHWTQGIINPDTKEWGLLSVCDSCSCEYEIRNLMDTLMFNVSPLIWDVYYDRAISEEKDELKRWLKVCKYSYSSKKFNLAIKRECEHGIERATKRNTRKKKISIFI